MPPLTITPTFSRFDKKAAILYMYQTEFLLKKGEKERKRKERKEKKREGKRRREVHKYQLQIYLPEAILLLYMLLLVTLYCPI